MKQRHCICIVTLLLFISQGHAALLNGDFSTGINAWEIDSFGGGDNTQYFNINSTDNPGNSFLKLDTGLYLQNLRALTFKQDVLITADNARFSALIKVFQHSSDASGSDAQAMRTQRVFADTQ